MYLARQPALPVCSGISCNSYNAISGLSFGRQREGLFWYRAFNSHLREIMIAFMFPKGQVLIVDDRCVLLLAYYPTIYNLMGYYLYKIAWPVQRD